MYQTTLSAKRSLSRRYDPVDDLMLYDDTPVTPSGATPTMPIEPPFDGTAGDLQTAMQESTSVVADDPIGSEAELDVAVDPCDEAAVSSMAMTGQTGVDQSQPERDEETTEVTAESDAGETPSEPAAAKTATAETPLESSTDDHGASNLWSAPTVTGKPMPQLPPKGSIASLGIPRAAGAPERIGSGRLVPARLTWKPREALALAGRPKREFRWDTMLTTACITAACGIGCIWLLRAILA